MKKILVGIFSVLCLSSVVLAKEPESTVVIDHFKIKKPPVTLNHKKHVAELKIECKTCHHNKKEGEKEEQTKCSDAACHGKGVITTKDGQKIDPHSASAKENPFHIRCLEGCHKKLPDSLKDKKPALKCDCHPKAAEEKK